MPDTDKIMASFTRAHDAQARAEADTAAASAVYPRIATWAYYLPLSEAERAVLGRIYAYQSSGKQYVQSHNTMAREINATRRTVLRSFKRLLELKYIIKQPQGTRKPAAYTVDTYVCVTVARAYGWQG